SDRATRRKTAMSCPQAHSLGPDCLDALRNEIQRLIPARSAPGIRAAIITNLRVEQPSWIAKDLVGATAAHAEEPLTVRIVLVTADGLELAVIHLDQHSAECWVAIHGTHGPHEFRAGHGHLHLEQRGKILSKLWPVGTGLQRPAMAAGETPESRRLA